MMSAYDPQRLQIILAGKLSVPSLKTEPDVIRVLQMTKIIEEDGGETVKIFTSNRDPSPGRHFEYISEKPVPGTKSDQSETRIFSGRNYDELFCKGPKTVWEIMFDKYHNFFEFVHPADGQVVFIVHPGEVVKVTKGRFEQRKEIAEHFNEKFRRVFCTEVDPDDFPKFYAADPVKEEFREMMKRTAMMMIDDDKFYPQILLIAMGSSTAFVGLFKDVHDLNLSIQKIDSAGGDKIKVIYRNEEQGDGFYGTKIVMATAQMLTLAKVKATSE